MFLQKLQAFVKITIKGRSVPHTRIYTYTDTSAQSLTIRELREWLALDPPDVELDYRTLKHAHNRKTGVNVSSDAELRERLSLPGHHLFSIHGVPKPELKDAAPAPSPSTSRGPTSAISVRARLNLCVRLINAFNYHLFSSNCNVMD